MRKNPRDVAVQEKHENKLVCRWENSQIVKKWRKVSIDCSNEDKLTAVHVLFLSVPYGLKKYFNWYSYKYVGIFLFLLLGIPSSYV